MDFLDPLWFAPPGMSAESAGFLVFCSALTSLLTATAGVGGGVLLFAIMAWLMPLTAVIPVHGAVQIGSNVGRLLIMARSVQISILLPFLGGSAIGGALGAVVVVQLPPTAMQIALGGFILWMAWMKPPTMAVGRSTMALSGLAVTFLTMFFGATAPLIAAVLKLLQLDRLSFVATQSACVVAQHAIKVLAFGFIGFAFAPYLPLIIVMIGAGFIGTILGSHVLHKIADQRFHVVLSCVLTVLASTLLAKGTITLINAAGASRDAMAQSTKSDKAAEHQMALLSDVIVDENDAALAKHELGHNEKHSDDLEPLTTWEIANDWLRKDIQKTQSALYLADRRTRELVERAMEDSQRIATLERDFDVAREQLAGLRRQMNDLTPPKLMSSP